jgi:uncharacterized phage-associated protein
MAYDGRAVANLLLDLADELGLSMTHMALHKIAYFAHGWRLAQEGRPLVRQPFEAWQYGPVLSSVYQAFKKSGDKRVISRAMGFDPVEERSFVISGEFPPSDCSFIRDILLAYGSCSAAELSRLTHRQGGPWDQVWNAPGGKITLGMRISNDAIRRDFLVAYAGGAGARAS